MHRLTGENLFMMTSDRLATMGKPWGDWRMASDVMRRPADRVEQLKSVVQRPRKDGLPNRRWELCGSEPARSHRFTGDVRLLRRIEPIQRPIDRQFAEHDHLRNAEQRIAAGSLQMIHQVGGN